MTRSHPADATARDVHLVDQVAQKLRAKADPLPAGTKLPPESELVAEFGVSRTVVREAVAQLKSIGLITTRHGSGIFVAPPSETALSFRDSDRQNPTEIVKFLEIRSGLDYAAARLAAVRRSPAQLEKLRELGGRVMQGAGVQESVEADVAFHTAIVDASGNEHLVSVYRFLSANLREGIVFTRRLEALSPGMVEEVRQEHEAIVGAIGKRKADRAAALAETHVENAQRRLRRSLMRLVAQIGPE